MNNNNLKYLKEKNSKTIISSKFEIKKENDQKYLFSKMDNSKMIYIPAGKFKLGSKKWVNSQPIKTVYLDDYYMDIYPITNAQYKKFIDEGGYLNKEYWGFFWEVKEEYELTKPEYWEDKRFGIINPSNPVVGVTWYEAYAYAKWAGKILPTEAQWEKAAKGGIYLDGDDKKRIKNPIPDRLYPWGNKIPNSNLANYACNIRSTSRVGMFPEGISPYNIYDMAGNVSELCLDEYDSKFYEKINKNFKNPINFNKNQAKDPSIARILRGCSWNGSPVGLITSCRNSWIVARHRTFDVGFRCVVNISDTIT